MLQKLVLCQGNHFYYHHLYTSCTTLFIIHYISNFSFSYNAFWKKETNCAVIYSLLPQLCSSLELKRICLENLKTKILRIFSNKCDFFNDGVWRINAWEMYQNYTFRKPLESFKKRKTAYIFNCFPY